MSQEGQLLDKKSLRAVLGKTANWSELAKDCIAFANALGGTLLIGIEDGQDNPPPDQTIPTDLPDTIRRKLAQCSVNVAVFPAVQTAVNGGQFIALDIPRAMSVVHPAPMGAISCALQTRANPLPAMMSSDWLLNALLCLGKRSPR